MAELTPLVLLAILASLLVGGYLFDVVFPEYKRRIKRWLKRRFEY